MRAVETVNRVHSGESPRLMGSQSGEPEDAGNGLTILDFPLGDSLYDIRQREKPFADDLIFFGLGHASAQAARQVDGHSFIQEAGAGVVPEGQPPMAGG